MWWLIRIGALINREEFTPYGETSFGSFARKRYRFTGKERDEESGLSYHGARYYATYLGRWLSTDPAGTVDGLNLYEYARSNPMRFSDVTGHNSETPLGRAIKKAEARMKSIDAKKENAPSEAQSDLSFDYWSWLQEYDFLQSLKGIHDYQLKTVGVALKREKYPVTRRGGNWVFDTSKNQFFDGKAGSEYPGSFCLGSARNFGMRVLFGKDLPTYRQQLTKHKNRIEDFASKSMALERAEEFIERIVTHTIEPGDRARFNKGLAQRYENKISNIEFVASNSRGEALKALEQGSPVMVGSGYHWVMVVRSPRGQLWEIDSYMANEASGVFPISSSEFVQLGSLFEIIVDATTKEPIALDKAKTYRK